MLYSILSKSLRHERIITHRPADDIEPELEKYRSECAEYATCEEDVLSYAVFNQVAVNFFKYRLAKNQGVDKDMAANGNKVYPC